MFSSSLRIPFQQNAIPRALFAGVVAVLMFLACSSASFASAQSSAKVQGVVRGANGTPLANALVAIENANGHGARSARTDGDGGFSFATMRPGPYLLAIDAAGHAPLRRGFVLGSGMMAGVDLSIRLAAADSMRNGTAVTAPGDFKVRAISPMELVTVHANPAAAQKASLQTRAQVQGVNAPATFGIYSPVLSPSPIGFGFSESEGGGIDENEWQGNGSNTATYDAITSLAATAAGTDTTFIATDANNQVGTDLYQSVTTGYFNGATALTYRFVDNAWTLLRTDTIANYVSNPNSPGDATGSITFADSGPATQQGDVMWIYLTNTPGQIPLEDVYYRGSQYPTYCLDWQTVANDATGGCYPLNENAPAPYEIVSDVPGSSDIANFPSGSYTSASSLQLVGSGSGTQGLQNYTGFYQCNSGDELYMAGHTYEFGVWLKGSTADGNVTVAYTQFPGTFYGNNGIGHTFTGVNNTWQYFTWDFPAPGCVPQGSPVVQLNMTFNGPGTVEFNGIHEFDTAYPPFQLIPQVQQAWADFKPSTIRIWSGFSDTAGGYQFWSLDSWIQNEWQGRTSPQIGNFYTTDIIALRLPAALAAAKAAGANPWLIVSMDYSAEDWSNLVDYLAAPAGVGYAAKRPANHPGPYVGEGGDFPFIYLEVGNEEWGTQETPLNFAYGQWVHYVASNSTTGKSYASQSTLLADFKFVTNSFFLEPTFGSAAIAQAPESTVVDYALYNSGDTNLTGPAYYQSDLVQLPVTNQPLIDAMVSQQKSDASNGHPYTLAAYESGPGADVPAHQGDPSLAAATATMDVDLYAQLRGFNPVNFFLFGEGTGPYTSHTNFAGGFIPHPVWEASQMRNLYLHGDMVWTVPAAGNPTVVAPDNNQSYPAISTYAFHDANNQVDVAVISRDFYNSTPVTLNLPGNATGTAYIYSLSPSAGGDPSDTNDTSLLVPINSTTASVSGSTFSFNIPPGSFYIIQIPLNGAWTTNIPAPAAPTGLIAHAGNTSVDLSWSTVDGATSYNVLRGTKSGGESATPIGTATGPSYSDTSVVNGTEYYYVVTAANVGGTSGPSNEVSATPNVADAPIVSSQPPLDGSDTGAWLSAPSHPLLHDFNTYTNDTASYKVLWDDNYLYVLATVQDSTPVAPTEANVFVGDSVEVYFSGTDTQNTSYGPTDFQYAFPYGNGGAAPTESHHDAVAGVIEGQQNIAGGYQLAIALPWTTLGTAPVAGKQYGFDVMVNDATSQGVRDGKLAWWGTVDQTYYNPSLMGPLVLSPTSALPATTTTLTIHATAGLVVGDPYTLTAVVTPVIGNAVPAGQVIFNLSGAHGGRVFANLDSTGKAVYSGTWSAAETFAVSAEYVGSAKFASSISATQPATISGIPTETVLEVNPATSLVYDQPWTVSATVTAQSGGLVPSGTVTFTIGSIVRTAVLNSEGTATVTVPTLPVQNLSVQATYGGTYELATSASASVPVTIAISPTITSFTLTPTTLAAGEPYTIDATVAAVSGYGTPTGVVTITAQGPTTISARVGVNAAGHAVLTGAAPADGNYIVTATYSGSSGYSGSVSAPTPVTIAGKVVATTVTLTQSPSSGLVTGQPWTLTAQVAAGSGSVIPTGSVTFYWKQGSATVAVDPTGKAVFMGTVPPVGANQVYASYSGSTVFGPSHSAVISFTALGPPTTTSLLVNPSGSVVTGQSLTLTAQVAPVSGTAIPTGSVTFTIGTATDTVVLNASGAAVYTTTAPAPGPYAISASYSGSSSLASSTSAAVNETVTAVPTNTAFTLNPSSGLVSGQPITLTATVTATVGTAVPSGNVVFNLGSATQTVVLDGTGKAVLSTTAPGSGSVSFSAAYQGTVTFASSNSTAIQETITGAPTATVLAIAPGLTLAAGQPFTLTATVSASGASSTPGGNVTFTIGSATQSVALNGSGVAILSGNAPGAGTYAVSAAYGGNSAFASSTSTSTTLNVVAAGTAIPIVVPNYSFEQGGVGYNVPTNWTFTSSGTSGNYGLQQIEGQASNPLAGGDGADYWAPSDFNGSTSNGTSTPYGTSTSTLTTSAPVGVFAANTQYSLTVAIADPADGEALSLKTIAIQLLANGVVVATAAPGNLTPGGPFTDFTLNFYTSSHPAVVGQNITIALAYTYTGQYNRQAFYDNVRLSQTYGVSQPLVPTTTALSITPNSGTQVSGQSYTLTAVVSQTANSDVPTGSVTFSIGSTTQTAQLNGSATATYTGTVPSPGSWSISAAYSGDGEFATSTSNTLSETVVAPGTPVPITIPNYSFEANSSYNVPDNWTFVSLPAYSNGGTYAQQYIASGSSTPMAEDGSNYWSPFAENGSTPPYGDTTAILTTGASLGTFAANTTYNLIVALASENDGDAQYKTIGFELLANGVAVANFESTTVPEGAPFADYSISFDTASDPSVVGQNITVALLYNYTGPYNRAAYFDNVRLTQASDLSTTLAGTTTALSIHPPGSILDAGTAYTLKAVVTASGGGSTPAGNVLFNVGGVAQTVALDGTGTAQFNGTAGALGFVPIFALYQGSSTYAPSQSATLGETVIASAPVETQVNLTTSFNTYGIYTDGTAFSTGGVDGDGNAYSGTLLGSSLTLFDGTTVFDFGPANQPDVVKGNGGPTIPLPNYNFSTLTFLGTGLNGGQASQPFTVSYSDGTSATFSQGLSDWFASSGYFAGETVAKTYAYRNGSNGQPNGGPLNLYVYSFSIDPTRVVTSLTLPDDGNVAIFAITLLP